MALQKPVPDVEDFLDETKPDVEGMRRHLPIVQQFKDALCLDDHCNNHAQKTEKAGGKRKATEQEPQSARTLDSIDWAKLAENGELTKLTRDILKSYLQLHRLPVSGRKADLVQRINEHILRHQK